MNKFIFLTMLIVSINGCEKKPYLPPQETEKQTKARYEKLLACKPDKPLSKGELYEKAMVRYWQLVTNSAFGADYAAYEYEMEKPKEYRVKLTGNEYQIKCGLTYRKDGTPAYRQGIPDKVTNDVCYPYQVYQFNDLRDFYFSSSIEKYKNKNLNDFIINNKAKVYRWDKQPPIYKAENYNKDVDFMVRQSISNVNIYPKDCCKLLSYEELLTQEKNGVFYFSRWNSTVLPKKSLTQYNFLTIKKVLDINSDSKLPYDAIYFAYPITHCGEIL